MSASGSAAELHGLPVNRPLTSKRQKPPRPTSDLIGGVRRLLIALSRRVGDGELEHLHDLREMAWIVDQMIQASVDGLRADGFTWQQIGDELGMSRQGAQQRYGR